MQFELAMERLRVSLSTRSIDPRVLFSCWDLGKKGRVSTEDVISGIQALQIGGLSHVEVQRSVRKASGASAEWVGVENWTRLFPEAMVSRDKDVYDTGFNVVSSDGALLTEIGGITDSHKLLFQMLTETDPNARYKVKLMPHSSVAKLWSSSGLNCPALTVWTPTQLASGGGLLHQRSHSVRERVCLGHLVAFSFERTLTECTVIEIRDLFAGYPKKQQGETLEEFIEMVFPRPTSYRLIWSEKSIAKNPLYVWRPVPRNEAFQAVGVVCTTTPKEPSITEVRTIPRQWLAREMVNIRDRQLAGLTWRDSGRRVWAQELLSVMDADKEGSSELFPMWKIFDKRFFLASNVVVKKMMEETAKTTVVSSGVVKLPPSLLDDSPKGVAHPTSLLDSPTHGSVRTAVSVVPPAVVSLLDSPPAAPRSLLESPPATSLLSPTTSFSTALDPHDSGSLI